MTTARLFLANCLIWLLTLASPAGAGHLVVADLQGGIAQSVFAGLQEGAPERLPGQSDDEYFAVYNAWTNDVAAQENLLGAVVGYTTSGGQAVNVSNAASIAQSGALNNYLGHTDLAVLADRLAECRADGACTEEELFSIRDEMLARSLANDEALASCLTQACVEEHLAAVAGLDAFREAIGTDQAARQIIGSALQRNAGVDVGLLAVLGANGGTVGPTLGPQDWALARAALNVANAETILQQCGQDAACMIAVANEIQADEAFVDLLRDLPGVGGVIAANDCAMTGDALTCAAVSVEALGAAGDMLQNGRRVLLRMGDDTVPATVRTTDEGVEVVTDAGDVVRVADAPNRTLDPTEVSFSQATVSGRNRDGLTIDELEDSMRQNGWQGEPLNVISGDGVPTSMDNRRLLAARRAGIEVPVTARYASDPLTPDQVREFTVTGQPAPSTWGEALDLRIGRQGEMRGAPSDWAERFPNGSIYDPVVVE
ncbi:hypothetical protein [Yoonia sp. R78084]|uniref:hypothetical protein n=1 Tax=Yoonia sp. R78084 TaxID=3093869 RepID=UPI0037DD2962